MLQNTADIGRLIRQARKAAGWSQADLAARTGLRQTWISQIENDKPTAEIGLVFKVLDALGIALTAELPVPAAEETSKHEPRQKASANQARGARRISVPPVSVTVTGPTVKGPRPPERPTPPTPPRPPSSPQQPQRPGLRIDLNAHLERLRRKPRA